MVVVLGGSDGVLVVVAVVGDVMTTVDDVKSSENLAIAMQPYDF